MALVLKDRVQETGTANTTVSFTLSGASVGFQAFSAIGDGNTTFYAATDASGNWEAGIGTYSTTGPTLTRTTILSSSNSNTAVTFSGDITVFVTYPSEKSVNLDDAGNVTGLGTVASATWQGSTVGVAYGGTGVTSSSGPNSVVLRDANGNVSGVNNAVIGITFTTASAGTTTLIASSTQVQALVGSTSHTFRLPDATTLIPGIFYTFSNASSGTLTVEDYTGAVIETIEQGGAAQNLCTSTATVAGTWGYRVFAASNVTWGNATLDYNGAITSATWEGDTIAPAHGGTGLTGFAGANNALYSTGASTLTAGTLPIEAGGTSATTPEDARYNLGLGPSDVVEFDVVKANSIESGLYISPNAGVYFTTSATDSPVFFAAGPSPTATGFNEFTGFQLNGNADSADTTTLSLTCFPTGASIGTGQSTTSGPVPLTIYNGPSSMVFDGDGNVGINTYLPPSSELDVFGTVTATTFASSDGSAASPSITNTDDTNTGIFFPAADTVSIATGGTERLKVDASGNLGLDVTPSAWSSTYKAIQVKNGAVFYGYGTDETGLSLNTYYDSGYKYMSNGAASTYIQYNGDHLWFTAPSGTAGAATTLTRRLTLTQAGGVAFGSSGVAVGLNGQVLKSNGNAPPEWVNQTSINAGSAVNVSGTVGIANGGTGATSAADARTNLDVPTRTGTNASGTWSINVNGSAGSAGSATNAGFATNAGSATNAGAATNASFATTAGRIDSSVRNYSREWIEFPNHSALYSPINGAHFFPNNNSYGSWKITGERNGWRGLHFGEGTGITLMMNEGEFGFHREAVGWVARFTSGHFHGYANSAGYAGYAGNSDNLDGWNLSVGSSGNTVMGRGGSGETYANFYYYASDETLKQDIQPLENAEEVLEALDPCSFTWIESQKKDKGFIAQKVQKVIPEAISVEESSGILSINQTPIIAYLVSQVNALTARVRQLEGKDGGIK